MSKRFASVEERRAYWRLWYSKNKHRPDYKAKDKSTKKRIRLERQKWWVEYKKTLKCSQCDENHPACLDFHHMHVKDKEYHVSVMISKRFSKKRIQEEIQKCKVLCANCHRKLHFEIKHVS